MEQQLSDSEMEEFRAYQQEKARRRAAEQRKENREAYAQLVDEEIERCLPVLIALSAQISRVKQQVYMAFQNALAMKKDIMGMNREGQFTHTFTNSDGTKRIMLGSNVIDSYRDTVEDGIAMVKTYIESLATDDKSRALVNAIMRLLARDQKGTLKASRVLQLRKMAEETQDETFIEGVKIIEESYQPITTKQMVRADYRDSRDGEWKHVALGIGDVD